MMEDGIIVACYMSTLDLTVPFDENMAQRVAPKLPNVIFFIFDG